MPIDGVIQPEIIQIEPGLRLRSFDGKFDFALEWYQDPELVYLVDDTPLCSFRARLQMQDNMFGYCIAGLELV